MSELDALPAGWERAQLGEYVYVRNGYAFRSSEYRVASSETVPVIRISDINDGIVTSKNSVHVAFDAAENGFEVERGDLLIAMSGATTGKFGVYLDTIKSFQNQRVGNIRLISEKYGCKKYRNYLIENLREKILKKAYGAAQPNISASEIESFEVCIPPLKEQLRIVDKLEELLSDLDNGVAELKAAQTKLTQYRQSLLKSAVEGSLTAEWRSQNTPNETGAQLLDRILKERRQRWEQQKRTEFETKNQKPPKDWQKKYPEPVKPDTSDLPELPEGWVWASVDQLAWNKRYGSSSKTNDDTSGIPVLRMGNIQDGNIDYRNLKYLPRDHNEFPALLLSDGDLLFNRTNSAELVGKTAVFRDIGKPCSYASYLISVTFCDSYQPDLAAYFINSSLGKAWLSTVVNQTAGQANVNGTKLGELAIPVPPFDEQLAIIREMNSNQEQVSIQLENVELGIKQSESQRKNILKDAFSGKLVPQDPNDEPASILLDKIKAERVAQAKFPKPKRAKKKPNTMKNLDLDALKKWIAEFDKEHFTFADIEASVSADYENLKNLIFLALSESQPAIYQKFDENSEEVVFKKAGV